MKLAVTITTTDVVQSFPLALLEGDFESKVHEAAMLGFDGVELVVARPKSLEAARIRHQVEQEGLEIAVVSSGAQASIEKLTLLAGDETTRRMALQRLNELVDFAAQVGAGLVTIGSFRGRFSGQERRTAVTDLVAIFRNACAHAEELDVHLAIEPLNRYETNLILCLDEALDLIDTVGQSNLGVLLDVFHMNIEEKEPCASIARALDDGRLLHVHIADSNRLPPGEGHIPFKDIFALLDARQYAGYCSAELLPLPTPYTAAERTMAYWRGCFPHK